MKWTRAGEYAITAPPYTVSKSWVRDEWKYTASVSGEILGHGANAEECKALCKLHARGK